MNEPLSTPVALIIFRRPDLVQQVFDEIKKVKPRKLFIIADGPRNESDIKKCSEARSIVDQIDWDCEVHKNYSDINLGCKKRESTGIDWFFENVEEGIVLEEDTLPDISFFYFCQELLKRYRNDTRIMHIGGSNFQVYNRGFQCDESYYFSKIPHIWGWATWRRAWKYFDLEMKLWPEVRKNDFLMKTIVDDEKSIQNWTKCLQECHEGKNQHYDYQWMYSCWLQNGLSIQPKTNLVINTGFGLEATHTRDGSDKYVLDRKSLDFPMSHPKAIVANKSADSHVFKYYFDINNPSGMSFLIQKMLSRFFAKK
jgi:hypothetical protein